MSSEDGYAIVFVGVSSGLKLEGARRARRSRHPGQVSIVDLNDMAKAHRDALYAAAFRTTGRHEDAEDLVQETFLRAWRSIHTYRYGTKPKAWLLHILRNANVDRYRASTRTVRVVTESEIPGAAFVAEDTPESLVVGATMESEIRDAFLRLPHAYRTCIVLADLEGYSRQEIAEALQIPHGTVLSRLFRGRRAMREALAGRGRARRRASAN